LWIPTQTSTWVFGQTSVVRLGVSQVRLRGKEWLISLALLPLVMLVADSTPRDPSNLGSIWPKYLRSAFTPADPKIAKCSQVMSVFLCFWDLQVQKLLVKRWWTWHQGHLRFKSDLERQTIKYYPLTHSSFPSKLKMRYHNKSKNNEEKNMFAFTA